MTDPILLLPGLLCDHRLYAGQLPALAARGEVTVADLTGADTIAGLAAHVLATAPARFALVGLSMGGYVAFEILRRAPERVTRLALLDTQARADTEEAKARRRGLMELAEKGEFKGVTPAPPAAVRPPRRAGRPADRRPPSRAWPRAPARTASCASRPRSWAAPTAAPACAAIACPTLILAGREDQLTPVELQLEMAQADPRRHARPPPPLRPPRPAGAPRARHPPAHGLARRLSALALWGAA